jgi:flagellar motor switch protein FliM
MSYQNASAKGRQKHPASPTRHTIHACNFRYAGRLSNDNARILNTLHEKFAANAASSLEIYLGTTLELKLISLEQMAVPDYINGVSPNAYLMRCALNIMESNFLLEVGVPLVFPIIDLLLGGDGTVNEEIRELTDIDEEMLQSISELVLSQLEKSWKSLNLALTPGNCIKVPMIPQVFPVNEKLVILMFQMTAGGATGLMKIILPTSFVGFLLRQLMAAHSKRAASARNSAKSSLKERILDCNFTLAADITEMRVLVKDLIGLKPGMHLKMKAPVANPGRLTVDSVEIFESVPVRNGAMKATQLLVRSQESASIKEYL